ncbi:low molecular weight phosphatase family protein [Agrococcus sp. HG114]|uniref:arsenate reductase/protein-tyrosine-phosphatase family protein n=1 Tax=Agrococcus sp. HG114 TaxID=2969757 RepID=UPI00215B3553|nr:low molecular weight phosphatase family protein [Agrococcus sp. HG114]MCR8669837.1 low molecular weight phosphatase family protein [Agrococcus sp. HG114]
MSLPSRRPRFARPRDRVFRILAVCSGNVCRSAQAEQLLRLRIPQAFGRAEIEALEVTSAGIRATPGQPMDPNAAAEVRLLGVTDSDEHRSRRLQRGQLLQADLILGLARTHRQAAIARRPSTVDRAFTLVEFTMLVEALAARRDGGGVEPLGKDGFAAFMRGVVRAAADARATTPMPALEVLLDIRDPYRHGAEVYRRSADSIDRNVARLSLALTALASREAAEPELIVPRPRRLRAAV